jgi:hypothetical protein
MNGSEIWLIMRPKPNLKNLKLFTIKDFIKTFKRRITESLVNGVLIRLGATPDAGTPVSLKLIILSIYFLGTLSESLEVS